MNTTHHNVLFLKEYSYTILAGLFDTKGRKSLELVLIYSRRPLFSHEPQNDIARHGKERPSHLIYFSDNGSRNSPQQKKSESRGSCSSLTIIEHT
jgi:hypothetical protein